MKKLFNLLIVAFVAMNAAYSQNFYYGWEGKKVPLNISKNGFLVEFKDESTVLDALQSYQKQNSTDKTEIVKVGKQIFLQITNEVLTNKMPHSPQTFKANTQGISPFFIYAFFTLSLPRHQLYKTNVLGLANLAAKFL